MFKLILVLISVLGLLACDGGTDQDPLKGEPASIRNAVEPKKKVSLDRRRQQRNSMILTMSPRPVKFMEGRESVFYIKGRLINELKNLKHEIKILNPPEGSRYIEETGEFVWTPAAFFVRGANPVELFALRVQIRAKCAGEKWCVRDEVFNIFVYKSQVAEAPRVISVSPIKSFYEDQRNTFEMVVEDKSSRFSAPKLNFIPEDKPYQSAFPSVVVSASQRVPGTSHQWKYDIGLEARGLTVSYDTDFSMFAYVQGENGDVSAPKEIKFIIKDATERPQIDVLKGSNFKTGVWNVRPFLVYVSPKFSMSRAKMEVEFKDSSGNDSCKKLVGEKKCHCIGVGGYSNSRSSYLCEIRWKPDVSAANTDVKVEVVATLTDTRDPSDKKVSSQSIWIKTVFNSPALPQSTKKEVSQ